MNIQRALMILVVCCIAASSLTAQSTRPRVRASKAMWTALKLTETQKEQVKVIHDKYAPGMKLAQKQAPDSAAVIYNHEMADVRALLTLTQQETFDSYMNGTRRSKRGGMVKVMPVKIRVP